MLCRQDKHPKRVSVEKQNGGQRVEDKVAPMVALESPIVEEE